MPDVYLIEVFTLSACLGDLSSHAQKNRWRVDLFYHLLTHARRHKNDWAHPTLCFFFHIH